MKITKLLILVLACSKVAAQADVPFDAEVVQQHRLQLDQNLKTNELVIAWKAAEGSATKRAAYNLVVQEIAGQILGRQWNHPSGEDWPIVDWAKVSELQSFFADQRSFIETTNAIAQNEEELARISSLMEVMMGLGSTAEVWFEDWLLDLAKSSNHNLKRLALLTLHGVGEDMAKETGEARIIDWSKWQNAYGESDNLGKAILIACISNISSNADSYEVATSIHLSVFNGSSEDLMAIALVHGTKKLGQSVVGKWETIADDHANDKLKSLANQALERE